MKRFFSAALVVAFVFTAAAWPDVRSERFVHALRPTSDTPAADTIPPLKDRYGDFLRDRPSNPYDLKDPKSVEKTVDFDPESGGYILRERIGDEDFRPVTFMTFEEYLEYRRKEDEKSYFDFLSGASGDGKINSLDPIAKIDVSSGLIDRLFGGTEVDIKPQGNIDLKFGF